MPTFHKAPSSEPRIVTVDGQRFRITPLRPRQALRVGFRVVKLLGEPLGALLSGAGLEVEGLEDENGRTVTHVNLAMLAHSTAARMVFMRKLLERLTDMDPEDLDGIIDDLLLRGGLEHSPAPAGDAFVPVRSNEVLDALLPSMWTLISLIRHAFEVSMLPTLAGGDTNDDAAPATTTGTSSQ